MARRVGIEPQKLQLAVLMLKGGYVGVGRYNGHGRWLVIHPREARTGRWPFHSPSDDDVLWWIPAEEAAAAWDYEGVGAGINAAIRNTHARLGELANSTAPPEHRD